MKTTNTENIRSPEINIVRSEDVALVCLSDRIDIDSSPALRDRLLALLQSAGPKIVSIDLSAVTHLDSSGVATLIEALKIARGHKAELRLQGLQGRLLHFFESTGILSLFDHDVRRTSRSGSKEV